MKILGIIMLSYFIFLLVAPILIASFWLIATFIKVGWKEGKRLYDSY
jgi:hypothetical protein